MNNGITQQLLNALQWRYATKVFDATRKIPAASLNFYRDMMLSDVVNGPRGKTAHEWTTRQTHNALGNLMTCAAVLGVDTCPGRPQPCRIRSCARLERQRLRDGAGLRAGLSRHHRQIREPVESVV